MSLVLPLPPPPREPHLPRSPFRSRPSTPDRAGSAGGTPRMSPSGSRPCTPPPFNTAAATAHANALASLQPISAPPTPVTPTHHFGASPMERCRSSEAAVGGSGSGSGSSSAHAHVGERDGRRREPKTTSLLFSSSSSAAGSTGGGAGAAGQDTVMVEDDGMDVDEIAPVPTEEAVRTRQEMQEEQAPAVWGMPKWGWDAQEVYPGVRLLDMEQLPALVDQHSMLDVPSTVLFPWLHGISDDGQKGRDMAAFFGHAAPFEPPPYRGLCLINAPAHPQDGVPHNARAIETRERSETMSTSSGSYASYTSGETDATSPSMGDAKDREEDVQMHPCESKRAAVETSSEDEAEGRSACMLVNALHARDVFDLPNFQLATTKARFRRARLPAQINLRNLSIQQIKYATLSDIVLYARGGASLGVLKVAEMMAQAQDEVYHTRMAEWYAHLDTEGQGEVEGVTRPVKYGVWVVREPFEAIHKTMPQLVHRDAAGRSGEAAEYFDLFRREIEESRLMTEACEVVEGFWVGNDADVPPVDARLERQYDLTIRASEMCDMPSSAMLQRAREDLAVQKEARRADSPAAVALRNILGTGAAAVGLQSHSEASDEVDPTHMDVRIACAGSTRTIFGQLRVTSVMADRVLELVAFIRDVIEGAAGPRRRVLLHCQDGYTESTIVVLAYVMFKLGLSLPEAFLHVQNVAGRSFFLYPVDKGLLKLLDSKMQQDRRSASLRPPPSPTRWKWSFRSDERKRRDEESSPKRRTRDVRDASAKDAEKGKAAALTSPAGGGKDKAEQKDKDKDKIKDEDKAEVPPWFTDRRFDGFPSRILPFLYLGNLEHAGNAGMLKSIGITHVVSVGESLINCPPDTDPMYGNIGPNALVNEYKRGGVQVLDLADIRDDGNDPLRPLIARACAWIEETRAGGGRVLVHCRVGVSRSASIVIAYLMQQRKMALMDAYLVTRARRLNVLIQPNLRFFHELFGWEVELAREEERIIQQRRVEAERAGVLDPEALRVLEAGRRRIYYSWPSFCRDLHFLNRRFLCN